MIPQIATPTSNTSYGDAFIEALATALPLFPPAAHSILFHYRIDDAIKDVAGDISALSRRVLNEIDVVAQEVRFLDLGTVEVSVENALQLKQKFPQLQTVIQQRKKSEVTSLQKRVDDKRKSFLSALFRIVTETALEINEKVSRSAFFAKVLKEVEKGKSGLNADKEFIFYAHCSLLALHLFQLLKNATIEASTVTFHGKNEHLKFCKSAFLLMDDAALFSPLIQPLNPLIESIRLLSSTDKVLVEEALLHCVKPDDTMAQIHASAAKVAKELLSMARYFIAQVVPVRGEDLGDEGMLSFFELIQPAGLYGFALYQM